LYQNESEQGKIMASRIVRLIPKSRFSVSGAASTSTDIQVGPRAIASQDWVSGVLIVRLHTKTFSSTTATVSVNVFNVSIAPEDPNTLFSTGGAGIGQITIANADTAPKLYEVALSAPIGPMLAVIATLNQGAATGACVWEMSVDLLGRDA
jgi:hypothetical protein